MSSANASFISSSARSQCGVFTNANSGGSGGSSAATSTNGMRPRGTRVGIALVVTGLSCSSRAGAMSSIVRAKSPTWSSVPR